MNASFLPKVPSVAIHVLDFMAFPDFFKNSDDFAQNWMTDHGFSAKFGQVLTLPDPEGFLNAVAFGIGDTKSIHGLNFELGKLVRELPEGNYHIADFGSMDPDLASLSWLLSSYHFDKYKVKQSAFAKLVKPDGIDPDVESIAESCHLTMDLINRPANDMTPDALSGALELLARRFQAKSNLLIGDDLLEQNFPLIHAVGRAGEQSPRLVELQWGRQNAAKITIIGKGVCFDTGGLDIKPSSSMGLMKKDMGGAANALGLSQMIMRAGLDVNLRLLLPIVENSIAGNAMRPGDILTARNGTTIEVNNTDAEGRLILADALSYASEDNPDLMISLATLTGAARVALGPDVPPFFTDDEELATALSAQSNAVNDPIWRLPFWDGYESEIEPKNAMLDNAPKGGMAGAITAALFLRRFAKNKNYVHFDLYGWNPTQRPGRPYGGAAQAIRAIYAYIKEQYGK